MSNKSFYVFSSGELKRKNDSLTFYSDNEIKKDIPVERVSDLYVFGSVKYNSELFNFLSQKGIIVHMFNYYKYYVGSFYPKEVRVSGSLLVKQVEYYLNLDKRLYIAKEFIKAASDNILRNLKYYNSRGKDLSVYIFAIEEFSQNIDNAKEVVEVMGIEGNIRKTYYDAWPIIINREIDFEKRVKRPPDNMINTLISFMNTVCYTKVLSEIYKTQLNPTISYLHEPSEKRFSLSLDVSEIFKPLLVDRTLFSLLNRNIITEKDFESENNYLRIKDKSVKKIIEELENTFVRKIKHRTLNREVSYQYLIRLELYKLIKHLYNDKEYKGFRIWW